MLIPCILVETKIDDMRKVEWRNLRRVRKLW